MSTSEIAKLESRWRENRQGLSFAPLAEAYRKMGDPGRALEVLAEGLAVNPDYIPASIVLGRCHLDLADDDKAALAFAHVLDLDAENVIALRALAEIAEREGRLGDARERLQVLLAVDRGNDDARAQLAGIEAQLESGVAGVPSRAPAAKPEAAPHAEMEVASAAVSWDDDEDEEPQGLEAEPAVEPAAEDVAPVPAARDDFAAWNDPEPEATDRDERAAVDRDDDLGLEQNLTPDHEIAPLEDLMVDDVPLLADTEVETGTVSGLLGLDMDQHVAEVEPLDDMLQRGVSGADQFSDLERVTELDLKPAHSNEFQVASAAEELGAKVEADADADRWAGGPPASPDLPHESTTPEFDTVQGTFGSDALGAGAPPPETGETFDGPFLEDEPEFASEDDALGAGANPPDAGRAGEDADLSWDDADADADADADDGAVPELVVTESMAELYLRQGHRREALAVYRLLYQRAPDDLRLRERVDELETALATPVAAASAHVVSLVADDEDRSVRSLFRKMLGSVPPEPPHNWQEAVAPPARPLEQQASTGSTSDGAATRPAADHLSLSDVFGEEGSPVPPAVRADPEPDGSDVSFDAFFGDAGGEQARSRSPARGDDDLDQFQSWLQNLKR